METLYPVVYLSLFIQKEEGNLGGTKSITSHIKSNLDYWTPLTPEPSLMDPSDLPSPPSAIYGTRDKIIIMQHFLEHLDTNGSMLKNFSKALRPEKAHILARDRIIGNKYTGDIQIIILWILKAMCMIDPPPPP